MIDLGKRTFEFALNVRSFIRTLENDRLLKDDFVQLIRSSGSVGANYIEANESLSRKDFIYRIKICLKEAKESSYWLRLIKKINNLEKNETIKALILESGELVRIFSHQLLKTLKKTDNESTGFLDIEIYSLEFQWILNFGV